MRSQNLCAERPATLLHDRFTQAPDYPATRRLYYLTSNLPTQGTPMENWKMKVVTTSQDRRGPGEFTNPPAKVQPVAIR